MAYMDQHFCRTAYQQDRAAVRRSMTMPAGGGGGGGGGGKPMFKSATDLLWDGMHFNKGT